MGATVLKHGKNAAEIEKSLLLSKLLREEGMPVVEYIEATNGKMFVSDDKGYYCLMRKLKGTHLYVFQSETELPFQYRSWSITRMMLKKASVGKVFLPIL